MGRYQRGVHFNAARMKRGEESSKFPVAVFVPLFSYTNFKQFINILATQNKNTFEIAHFWLKLLIFKEILFPGPQAKMLAAGKFM